MGKVLLADGEPLSEGNVHGLILYDAPASPCSRRVRITLLEKGLDWDVVNLNLGVMEQRRPDYLAINPNGFVPTLAHGRKVIFESGAINNYLEHQFPETPLLPGDAAGIAAVRQWQAAELAMARVFRPVMYQLTAGPLKRISRTAEENDAITLLQTDQPSDLAWERKIYDLQVLSPDELETHRQWLLDWLHPLEAALTGREYLVNDQFTQADIAVFPRLQMYQGLGLEVSPEAFPNLSGWMSRLEERDSFQRSMDDAARKYFALTRSPTMKKLRDYFATPEQERSEEATKEILEIGRATRERLGVEKLLAAGKATRKIPQPVEGHEPSAQAPCKPVQSRSPGKLSLHGNAHSPHSLRIRHLLEYLGRDFEYIEVDLAAGANRTESFLELNPLGEVPVLEADGLTLADSGAIAEFLCSSLPGGDELTPQRSYDRARHEMWLALESGTHKEFTPFLHQVMFASNPARKPEIGSEQAANLRERIGQKLEIVENALGTETFLMGEDLSFADFAWHSRIRSLQGTAAGDLLDGCPAITAWADRVDARIPSNA